MKWKQQSQLRYGDLARNAVYGTMPFFFVACIWIAAWSASLDARVRQSLEPRGDASLFFTRLPAHPLQVHLQQPVASVDQD